MSLVWPDKISHWMGPALRSRLRLPELQAQRRRSAAIVAAYLGLYLALDQISLVEPVDGVEFTLWNPTPGLGLALILNRGFRYAPVLFLAGVFGDGVLEGWPLGPATTVTVNAIVAIGYSGIAVVLLRHSDIFYGLRRVGDVIAALLIAGGGTLVVAAFVTGSLVFMQKLPADQFALAIRHFWTSDFCGIMGLLPAVLTARLALERWKELSVGARLVDIAVLRSG